MSSCRTGNQRPRIAVEPRRASTDGPDVADLSAAYGLVPDEWQRGILDCWLGRDENDMYTSRTCGLAVPRQNGKNALLEMRELYGLCIVGEAILHSAHEVKTAAEAFRRIASFFENEDDYPELNDLLASIRRTNGQEAIYLKNGGLIRFSARSRGAARGMTFDLIVMDEAQELTDEHMEAMIPTKSSAPLGNPQTILTGTPPNASGIVFWRTRTSITTGKDSKASWHEWSIDEFPDSFDEDRIIELAYDTNPALGIRITEEVVKDELLAMSPEGFARERLGWWDDRKSFDSCFSIDVWDEMQTDVEPKREDVGVGIKFSADGKACAIAYAARQDDGNTHVELARYEPMSGGMSFAVDWVTDHLDKCKGFAIDGRSNAAAFREMLSNSGVPKIAMPAIGANEAVSACSMLMDAYAAKTLRHVGDMTTDEAIKATVKRKIGNAGGFGFAGTGDIDASPVDAIALAIWALNNIKRDPRGKVTRLW